jgi:hypothetical protein
MMTLGLSDAALSDSARSEGARSEGAISEGIVMRLEWMDGTLPYGLLALTLRVADRIENAEGVLGRGMLAGEIDLMAVVLCVDKRDGSVGISSKIGSSKRDRLSKMSEPNAIEEVVETEDGVLVNPTRDRSAVMMGVDSVVEVGARREGEGAVGTVGDRDGVGDSEAVVDTVPVSGVDG